MAMLKFLRILNTVYNLGGSRKMHYCLEIEYALMMNHAGRCIVEKTCSSNYDTTDTNSNTDDDTTKQHRHDLTRRLRSPLPLSVWPLLLERSYEKSGEIYDF